MFTVQAAPWPWHAAVYLIFIFAAHPRDSQSHRFSHTVINIAGLTAIDSVIT